MADKNLGQQSNENWDDQNDQRASNNTPSQPNPERFADANLGQGSGSREQQNDSREDTSSSEENSGGNHAFNERHESTTGAGTAQRSEPRQSVGPLDADLAELPSHKRSGNQSGPGLG